jgi:tetratricopeptide (TPR) repeat protein
MKNKSAAIECYEKSLKIQEMLPAPNHKSMSIIYYNTARIYEELQNYGAALKHAECSINSARLAFGPEHSEMKIYQDLVNSLRSRQ